MARFVYRLQKVHDLRERKKKEQEQRVQDAQNRVKSIQDAIVAKTHEIRTTYAEMQQADFRLFESYDRFLKHLNTQLIELNAELLLAKQQLEEEKQKLIQAQMDFEAMVKHKENAKALWREEEKQRELKMMDEIAGQRYFRATQEFQEDLMEEAEALGMDPADWESLT